MSFPQNPFGSSRKEIVKVEEAPKQKPIWTTVQIGESWVVEDYSDRSSYLAATTHGRRTGKKFSSKRVGDNLIITRIA